MQGCVGTHIVLTLPCHECRVPTLSQQIASLTGFIVLLTRLRLWSHDAHPTCSLDYLQIARLARRTPHSAAR